MHQSQGGCRHGQLRRRRGVGQREAREFRLGGRRYLGAVVGPERPGPHRRPVAHRRRVVRRAPTVRPAGAGRRAGATPPARDRRHRRQLRARRHLRRGRQVPRPDVGLQRREGLLAGEAPRRLETARDVRLQHRRQAARFARHVCDVRFGYQILRADGALGRRARRRHGPGRRRRRGSRGPLGGRSGQATGKLLDVAGGGARAGVDVVFSALVNVDDGNKCQTAFVGLEQGNE